MIEVLFFASLREQLQTAAVSVQAERAATVGQLREVLLADNPGWADALGRPDLLVAVNQTLVKASAPVADADEVAFFPPVTGG